MVKKLTKKQKRNIGIGIGIIVIILIATGIIDLGNVFSISSQGGAIPSFNGGGGLG